MHHRKHLALGLAFATLACVLAFPSTGAAATCTKVASPAGSDDAAGTEAAPFRSVQRLADSLSAGGTGCLRAGTYEGNVKLTRAGIALTRYPGEKATVRGRLWLTNAADNVTVEGLYLDGTNAGRLPSPTIHADDVTFRRNDVTNNHTGICFVLGDPDGTWGRAARTLIELNRVHHCGRLPVTNFDHGIYVEGADETVIRKNWIYDNADYGVHLYPDARESKVTDNVIDGNGMGVLFAGEGGSSSSGNVVEGNVISNSKVRSNVEEWWGDGSGPGQRNVVRRNCMHAGSGRDWDKNGGIAQGDGGFATQDNSVADPEFADRSAKDFRLAEGSACRPKFAAADEAPGPDPLPPLSRRPEPAPSIVFYAAVPAVKPNRPVPLIGRVAGTKPRRGTKAKVQIRRGERWRTVARTKVRRRGRFSLRTRLKVRRGAKVARVRAVVDGVGRSRTVRLRVRR